MKYIIHLVLTASALLITAYVVQGFVLTGFTAALLTAFVLGIVNVLVKPLMLLITLPLNIMTLGLFTFVINALMLWLASEIVPGFDITGLVPALAGALVLSIVSTLISWFVPGE